MSVGPSPQKKIKKKKKKNKTRISGCVQGKKKEVSALQNEA